MSEFEVTDGDRILGEVENVTAGLERSFSLNLQAGDYGLKCPGGSSASEGTLTVTGGGAAGAAGAVTVSDSDLAAAAERYSRTDLVDFKANLDGSRAAFDAVRAALDKRDAALGTQIQSRFEAADRSLTPYQQGAGYVPYNRLTDADTRKLSQSIDALAEPLSQVSAKLVVGS